VSDRRTEFPAKVKVAAFERANKCCENCGIPIYPAIGPEFDHRIPAEMCGDNSLSNCVCLCKNCHKKKTRMDMRDIVKARKVERRHIGAIARKGRPIPGSRGTGLRKKMSGEVVRDSKW
jgi:5-methylcytosine-specific restriction endonuclease McrA